MTLPDATVQKSKLRSGGGSLPRDTQQSWAREELTGQGKTQNS